MKEKYGAEYYLNSEDCKQKTEKYLQNHNVSNVMHIPEVKEVSSIVDKLVAVDMSAAISARDLATALARANISAQLAGKICA